MCDRHTAVCRATCFLACVVQVSSSETVVDGEVKIKEDVPCRETAGVRGRADVRLGSRDRITGWPAVVSDTWDIDECKDAWSDRID